ncbi:MAG: hypothetical protein ACRDGE_10830 [Candidatus Limnocylindria bacterium]
MTLPPTMRRRTFLLGATGLGVSVVWRSVGFWPFLRPSPSGSERLAGLLKHGESARLVGREYLRVVPAEASTRVLTARVVERLPGGFRALDTAKDDRLHELVLRATLEDFRGLRTVELHGWVLARTEARLCALAALEERSATA